MNGIEFRVGNIAEAKTDAIVNAANPDLWMGNGVAGALKEAAGEIVERLAMRQGPIHAGQAVATHAGALAPDGDDEWWKGPRYIVHTACIRTADTEGPRTDKGLVLVAIHSALRLADALGCESVALPALGTGIGGFELEEFVGVMQRAFHGDRGHDHVAAPPYFILERDFDHVRRIELWAYPHPKTAVAILEQAVKPREAVAA